MYYCNECAKEKRLPIIKEQRLGICDICGNFKKCSTDGDSTKTKPYHTDYIMQSLQDFQKDKPRLMAAR